jgi:pSer/pThr/pTyr-binding forkhead associated (FHA) protein
MQIKILVTRGKVKEQRTQLELPAIVGRSTDADLTINHPSVSRQHCELYEAAGRVRVRDLGSTNGTRVGGKKVAEAVLRPHDRFSIGPFILVVDYEAPQSAVVEGEEGPAAAEVVNGRNRLASVQEPSDSEESNESAGASDEGPSAAEAIPNRLAQPRSARSPQAKSPIASLPATMAPQSKRPPNSGSSAATASQSAGGPDPELGIDLDELLEGLEGLNLKDFLKGIE